VRCIAQAIQPLYLKKHDIYLIDLIELSCGYHWNVFCCNFLFINIIKSPDHYWVIWPAPGWGVGVLFHGLNVFEAVNFFWCKWEKRQIEKKLNNS